MMLIISQFNITYKNSLLLLILLGIVFTLFSVFVYRKTIPPVPSYFKKLLLLLRSLALILLLFILFEMTVNFIRTFKTLPHIAVVIDNSASMGIKDKAGNRTQLLSQVNNDPVFKKLKDQFVLKYFTFSNKVQPIDVVDSLTFTGDVTDITNSMRFIKNELAESNLAGIILMTDGNYNQGGNPVRYMEEMAVPVYPVGIGSPEAVPDIAIVNIEYNPYAYINEPSPVQVTIRNMGYKNIKLPLTLFVNGVQKISKIINVPPSPSEIQETIEFMPETPGSNKLVLNIPSQPDELSLQNNFRTIYIDVFKAKLNILILSGSLSPDISFLKRHIASSDRYTVNTFVEKSVNSYYQINETEIENADIFIFQDFPTINTSAGIINRLLDRMQNQSIPLFMIMGKNINPQKLKVFNEFLPFKADITKINEKLVYPVLTEKGKNDQVMQISKTGNATSSWSKLPPVYITHLGNTLWPNSEVLADYKVSGSQNEQSMKNPLIITRKTGPQKSVAVMAYGIWRWDLLMWGVKNNEEVYYNFVNNLLRWLETKKEIKPVQIKTDNKQYNFGDPVKISVEILNNNMIPNDRNEIVLSLRHNQETENIIINKSGESKYEKTIYLDKSGDFELSLNDEKTAAYNNDTDKALFSIGEYSSELSHTRLQKALLQGMAKSTGGQYVDKDSLFILENTINGSPRSKDMTNSIEFWNNRIVLFLIISLLTLEWFLRKKKGML